MEIFHATLNTRPILDDSLRFIRSDVPAQVTEEERTRLLSHNVTTVLDLRTDSERNRKPCPLAEDPRFSYRCFPIAGGNAVPACPDAVSQSYIAMVDTQFRELVRSLLETDRNVLYFCSAGKDRTGVLSAVLLWELGMSEEYILRDYLRSGENLRSLLTAYAASNPETDIRVITPQARYILEFLDWYKGSTSKNRHG